MQQVEAVAWKALAEQLAKDIWNDKATRDKVANLLGLGDYRPDVLTDGDIGEGFQRHFMPSIGANYAPFGMGPNMPSQWQNPIPILRVKTVALHAGVGEEAVRAAIRREALRHLYIDGSYFVRVSDAENYYGAWDSDKSERLEYKIRQYGRFSICNGIAYLLDPLETVSL